MSGHDNFSVAAGCVTVVLATWCSDLDDTKLDIGLMIAMDAGVVLQVSLNRSADHPEDVLPTPSVAFLLYAR